MNFKIIYFLGAVVLFLGLLWSLLPHAFHEKVSLFEKDDSFTFSHQIHLLEGLITAIFGLIILIYSDKKIKKQTIKNRTL